MELTDFTTISKNDIDFLVDSNGKNYKKGQIIQAEHQSKVVLTLKKLTDKLIPLSDKSEFQGFHSRYLQLRQIALLGLLPVSLEDVFNRIDFLVKNSRFLLQKVVFGQKAVQVHSDLVLGPFRLECRKVNHRSLFLDALFALSEKRNGLLNFDVGLTIAAGIKINPGKRIVHVIQKAYLRIAPLFFLEE